MTGAVSRFRPDGPSLAARLGASRFNRGDGHLLHRARERLRSGPGHSHRGRYLGGVSSMNEECTCGPTDGCPKCPTSEEQSVPLARQVAFLWSRVRCLEEQVDAVMENALAAGARSDETTQLAQSEASQSGGSASERNAQTQSSTPDNKDTPNA